MELKAYALQQIYEGGTMIILRIGNLILRRIRKPTQDLTANKRQNQDSSLSFLSPELYPPTHWLNLGGRHWSSQSQYGHTHLPHQEWWFPVSRLEGSPCLCNALARAHFPRSCQRTTSHTAQNHQSDSTRGFPAGHTWHTSNHWKVIGEQLV